MTNNSSVPDVPMGYDENMDLCLAVIYFIMAVTVLTLNGLEIYLIYRLRREKSVTNVFIVSLTVTDILMGSLGIPFSAIAITHNRKWIFGKAMCNITGFVVNTAAFTSLISICLITINRFLALVLPLSYKRLVTYHRALMAVILCWFIGFFRSSIPFIGGKQYVYYSTTLCSWSTSELFGKDKELPYFLLILVLPFALAFCAIIYCLTHMAVVLIRRSEIKKAKKGSTPGSGKAGNDKEKEAVITTLCIIIAFVLSYFCYYLSLFVYLLNKFKGWTDVQFRYLEVFMVMTIYMNSLFNPILYILRNTKFRSELMHLKASLDGTYRNNRTNSKRRPILNPTSNTGNTVSRNPTTSSKVHRTETFHTEIAAAVAEGEVVSNAGAVKDNHLSPDLRNGV